MNNKEEGLDRKRGRWRERGIVREGVSEGGRERERCTHRGTERDTHTHKGTETHTHTHTKERREKDLSTIG